MSPPSAAAAAVKSPENGGTHQLSCADLRSEAEKWRRLRRCLEAAGKGFAIGAGLKGGLALFSILARLRSRRNLRKVGALTNSEAVAIAMKETVRYGLFLGTFAGTFVSVDELIAAVGGHKKY